MSRKPFMEIVQKMMRGEHPRPPIGELIGMAIVEFGPNRAVFEMDTDKRHTNPMGTLHGGILCDIADGAMGMAWASELVEGETFTTLELKINFLKPIWNAHLRAEGRVI